MDLNTFAKSIVDQAIGDKAAHVPSMKAIARGKARAQALTPERRSEIAKAGSEKRWNVESGTSTEK